MSKQNGSSANLSKVESRIGPAIKEFVNAHIDKLYYGDELRQYVESKVGKVAPSSPTRVQQDMRKNGLINYELVSRSQSLYKGLPLAVEAAA